MVKLITISKTVKDLDYQQWSYDSHMKITFFDNSCKKKIVKKINCAKQTEGWQT